MDTHSFNSQWLSGRIRHRRLQPIHHVFQYNTGMLALDLDEWHRIGALSRWMSVEGRNWISLRRADYFRPEEPDLKAAIAAAHDAHRTWSRTTTVADRAALIRRVAELHRERREELADIIVREMGKPLEQALGDPLPLVAEDLGELRDDAPGEGDVAGLDLDAGGLRVGGDDRQERVRRQQRRLVGVRVDDRGHGVRTLLVSGSV